MARDMESVGIAMDDELKQRIQRARWQFAEDEGSTPSRSDVVRRLLRMGLAAHEELHDAQFIFDDDERLTADEKREAWVRQAAVAEINWELDQPPADDV